MLTALSIGQWIALLGILFLCLGPGYALLSFFPGRQRLGFTRSVALAAGLSISIWPILLAWLQLVRVRLVPAAVWVILAGAWFVAIITRRLWLRRPFSLSAVRSRLALWGAVVLTAAVSLWVIRNSVAGLGSDSYHHSLIAQLIAERGGLPDNYEPYAPLATFRYHYGFHALVAVIIWTTRLSAIVAMPLAGQLLMAVAALSVAFFTETATGSRTAAAIAAALAGLASVFPAYLANWGRYTQLAGMVLLPLFLGLVWEWLERRPARGEVPFVALLAAGIALTHARVMLMAAIAVGVLLAWRLAGGVSGRKALRVAVARLAATAVIAALLGSPWAWHLWSTRQQGYALQLAPLEPASFFSLDRLGPHVRAFPTNAVLVGLVAAAIALGWWWRDPVVRPLSLWAATLWIASAPWLLGINMDTVTVFIALYFPASAAAGWMLVRVDERLRPRWPAVRLVMGAGIAALSLRGAVAVATIHDPVEDYVRDSDLRAAAWIRANTPSNAHFMVNTFHFDFSDDQIFGSDAGYWLPLLAERSAVTVPITYSLERSSEPDLAQRLVALDRLDGHLTSLEADALLEREGVMYVYIGQRGGKIRSDELLQSAAFALEYQDGPVYVFRLLRPAVSSAQALVGSVYAR